MSESTALVVQGARDVARNGERAVVRGEVIGEQELPGMPPQEDDRERDERHQYSSWGEPEDAQRKAKTRYVVPSDSAFGDESVQRAYDLERIVSDLLRAVPLFGGLLALEIHCFWQRRGGSKECHVKIADPIMTSEAEANVIMWLAADNLRKIGATELYVEQLVFDCLYRIDASKPSVQPHEVSLNPATVMRYGWLSADQRLWWAIFREMVKRASGQDDVGA